MFELDELTAKIVCALALWVVLMSLWVVLLMKGVESKQIRTPDVTCTACVCSSQR